MRLRSKNILRRQWITRRQAYAPSLWLTLAIVVPVGVMIGYGSLRLVHPAGARFLIETCAAAVAGGLITRLRWVIWRRQHPVVSIEVVAREASLRN